VFVGSRFGRTPLLRDHRPGKPFRTRRGTFASSWRTKGTRTQEFANHVAFAEDASLLAIQSIDDPAERAERILSLVRQESAPGSD